MDYGNYGIAAAQDAQQKQISPRHVTIRERLIFRQSELKQQLEHVNEALAALDKNPGAEEVMNACGKVL